MATAIEYGLIAALVSVGVITAIPAISSKATENMICSKVSVPSAASVSLDCVPLVPQPRKVEATDSITVQQFRITSRPLLCKIGKFNRISCESPPPEG